MTLSSRHRIRNSSPGGLRPSTVTEAPHNTNFHTWMGKKQFCFFQTAETGNRTPDSGVKGSGANHYPRAPARCGLVLCQRRRQENNTVLMYGVFFQGGGVMASQWKTSLAHHDLTISGLCNHSYLWIVIWNDDYSNKTIRFHAWFYLHSW